MADNYQNNLSEQLQLLNEIGYLDWRMRDHHSGTHRDKMSRRRINTYNEVRLLEMITVALTTGNPEDVIAATFDKREGMELILAKMGFQLPKT